MPGKKRGAPPAVEDLLARPWCYYCERDFDDLRILTSHQKAKHFKCPSCSRRLNTAGGLSVHMAQVHKETLTEIANSLEHRKSTNIEIFGMEGIPEDLIKAHEQHLTDGYAQKEAEHRAQTGNPPPGTKPGSGDAGNGAKKLKVESIEETKKRLAEHAAKRKAEKAIEAAKAAAGLSNGRNTPANVPTDTTSSAPPSTEMPQTFPYVPPTAASPPGLPMHNVTPAPPGGFPLFTGMHGQPVYSNIPPVHAPQAYATYNNFPSASLPTKVGVYYPTEPYLPYGATATAPAVPTGPRLPARPSFHIPNLTKEQMAQMHAAPPSQVAPAGAFPPSQVALPGALAHTSAPNVFRGLPSNPRNVYEQGSTPQYGHSHGPQPSTGKVDLSDEIDELIRSVTEEMTNAKKKQSPIVPPIKPAPNHGNGYSEQMATPGATNTEVSQLAPVSQAVNDDTRAPSTTDEKKVKKSKKSKSADLPIVLVYSNGEFSPEERMSKLGKYKFERFGKSRATGLSDVSDAVTGSYNDTISNAWR